MKKFYCQFCEKVVYGKAEAEKHLILHKTKVIDHFGWPEDTTDKELLKRVGLEDD